MGGSNHTIPGKGVKAPEPAKDPWLEAPVIPIILVPGVMGSNLRIRKADVEEVKQQFKKEGREAEFTENAWRPPNVLEPISRLFKEVQRPFSAGPGLRYARQWESYGPKLRQVLLNPDTTEVDAEGEIPDPPERMGFSPELDPKATTRRWGWGTVHWQSYGPFLKGIDLCLNPTIGCRMGGFKDHVRKLENIAEMAQSHNLPDSLASTKDEIRKAAGYLYPVMAFGYNWTQSTEESAKKLLERIESWIHEINCMGYTCKQAILVTHSMGGLVARVASKLDHGSMILGVIHGVMPAAGAPVLYRRMVAGWEPDGDFIFYNKTRNMLVPLCGKTADDTTAVVANAPGVLELLPSHLYPPGWLRIVQQNYPRNPKLTLSLPEKDPYDEIYINRTSIWRLVQPSRIDPANLASKIREIPDADHAWNGYVNRIKNVKLVHQRYFGASDFHSKNCTYAFFGLGSRSHSEIVWLIKDQNWLSQKELLNSEIRKDDGLGRRQILVKYRNDGIGNVFGTTDGKFHLNQGRDVERAGGGLGGSLLGDGPGLFSSLTWSDFNANLQEAMGNGDATVPVESATIAKAAVEINFGFKGIKHQSALDNIPVKNFIIASVYKIIQFSKI